MNRILAKSLLIMLLAAIPVLPQPGTTDKAVLASETVKEGERQLAIGTFYGRSKAYQLYVKAADLYKEAGDNDSYGVMMSRAGTTAQLLGEHGKAIKFFSQALPVLRETGNRLWEAKTLNGLAVSYANLGDGIQPPILWKQAFEIFKEIENRDEGIVAANNFAHFLTEIHETEKALNLYNMVLPYLEQKGDEEAMGHVLGNMAGVYIKQGDGKKALETLERALVLDRKTGNRTSEAIAINNIGYIYLSTGDTKRAVDRFNQALLLAIVNGNAQNEATTLSNLMEAYRISGDRQAAIFFGKQAVNKSQQLRAMVRDLDPGLQKSYLVSFEERYRRLADMLIEAGRFEQAEQVLHMLKDEEYFQFVRRDPDEIKNLSQRVYLTPGEKDLFDRYMALAGRVTLIGLDYAALDDRKRKAQSLSADEQSRYDKLSADLADANAAMDLFLEKQLLPELGKTEVAKIEYDRNLQARLRTFPAGTVALYTVVTPDRYRVVLTTPFVQVDGKTEISAAALNKKIFAFRDMLRNPAIDPRPAGKELYDILIKPIEKQLQGAGAKTLAWSLDGALRYIPIAALSPDGKTYLAEKYQNVVLTPRTRDGISDTSKEWQVLGLGVSRSMSVTDPEDPRQMITFRALPGAKKELERIVRDQSQPGETGILTGKRYLDADFTSRTLPDLISANPGPGSSRFTVLHIASHFRLGKDWKNSFLLLGDGNVMTLEQLSGTLPVNFGDVDLVTLSACNTAAAADSTGKEVDSLAEAIQAKGGKAILATLWSISDEGTSQLMAEFYRARKETPGITKAEALQAAQRALIGGKITLPPALAARLKPRVDSSRGPVFPFDVNKPFAHPYYWSPFVLIGNWR